MLVRAARILFFMMLSVSMPLGAMQDVFLDVQLTALHNEFFPPTSLNEALQRELYDDAFKFLARILNPNVRIAWLEQAIKEGHVMCMFELSKELCTLYAQQGALTPEQKTEVQEWYVRAWYRMMQDIECHNDASVWWVARHVLVERYAPLVMAVCSCKGFNAEIQQRARAWVKNLKHYRTPTWVGHYGPGAYIVGIQLVPESEWAGRRARVLEVFEARMLFSNAHKDSL